MSTDAIRTYHALYESAPVRPLYNAPWWLDATCGEGQWNALIADDHGHPVAAWPYYPTRIRGLSAIITPPFTQWLAVVGQMPQTIEYSSFFQQLPASSILDVCCPPPGTREALSWPVQLKYTYIIPGGRSPDLYRQGYNEGLRRNLRIAEDTFVVRASTEIEVFLQLCVASYDQRGLKPPVWYPRIIPAVFKALLDRSCGEIRMAYDQEKAVAGVMTARDATSVYYLAGGRIAGEKGASAHALLLDHAIRSAMQDQLSFDFEGSMNPGIANFFQAFGAMPQPYWQIRRYRGLGKLWHMLHR